MLRVLEMFGEPITYGGQESAVYNMLTTLDLSNEFCIDLFTPYYADNQSLLKYIDDNGGKVYGLNIPFEIGDNRFRLTKSIHNFFNNHSNYDVIHIHTGSLTTMLVYARSAKKHNIKKTIVHAHIANNDITLFYKIRKTILCFALKKYVDIFVGCSDKVITTKYTRDLHEKAELIYNGIDIDKFKYHHEYRNEIRNIFNIAESKYILGCLGRLSNQKNIYFMLRLIENLSNIDNNFVLMIVGTGELENDLKRYVIDHNLTDNVIFAGNQKEPHKFYSAFDIFLLPSYYEGYPMTAIEAQASGLNVLISKNITSESKVSNNAFFVSIDDISKWSDKILQLKKANNQQYIGNRINVELDRSRCDKNITYRRIRDLYLNE